MFLLYTEQQREKQMRSAAARKAKGKSLDSPGSRRSLNLSLPTGLAKGSMYEASIGEGRNQVESSINPLALASKGGSERSLDTNGNGLSLLDASGMNVVDSIAGMTSPPPAEVWKVVQATLKEMHSQVVEAKLREAQMLASMGREGGPAFGAAGAKTAFEPQALRNPSASAGSAAASQQQGGGGGGMMASFRAGPAMQQSPLRR